LAKADRLEVTYAKSETPTEPVVVDAPVSSPEAATVSSEAIAVDSPKAPKVISPHRHDPKPRKVTTAAVTTAAVTTAPVTTAALHKSKPKNTETKRVATRDRSKAAGDPEPCRLSAFGGLRKALNSSDCEI
jgi:hypothetical protein